MKTFLKQSANGAPIYALENNEHMKAHESITDSLIAEAVSKIEYREPFMMVAVDMGRIVGNDSCVPVTLSDNIKMMYRKGRTGKTPIVFDREPEETSLLTVGICKDDDGLNTVFTAFFGVLAPKEPWDPRLKEEEKAESESFWLTHALIYDPAAIDLERK